MPLKILNSEDFSNQIRKIMSKMEMSAIDSVVYFCEKNELDTEFVADLIDADVYSKIQEEAQSLHLIEHFQSLPFDNV